MYTSRFGQYVPVEGVSEEKDIVRGTVKGEGVDVENAIVSPMYVKNDEQKAKFVGVKEGDTFTFAPKVAYENVAELSSFLHITKDAAEELASDVEMTFTVTNITRYQEAEVNQELFDKAMGEGVVKNEEEFIAKIKVGAYFITICTQDRKRILSEIIKPVGGGAFDDPKIRLTAIGKTVEKYLLSSENISGVTTDQYIIMPDHIHAIIFLDPDQYNKRQDGSSKAPTPTNEMLPHIVSAFKRFCGKALGDNIFQRGYMDHIIRDKADYETRRKYIYENPMRWYYKNLNTEE